MTSSLFPRLMATMLLAALAGAACEHLRVPLPWMIGPLSATALAGIAGLPVCSWGPMRSAGQWAIGTSLGLYFNPGVLAATLRLAPVLALGIAWALLMGWAFYRYLAARSGARGEADHATAWFAASIGGASEMAVLGERHGGLVDRIAAAHALRVLIVVGTIPFALTGLGVHGIDPTPPGGGVVQAGGLAVLAALTMAGALLMHRTGLPNPWVLGPLLVATLLTASGIELSSIPRSLSNAGQLCIGIALGTRFTPDFVRSAPRWMLSVALGTVAMILASALFAAGLSRLAGLHWASVLLGTSPGGIAEMCITAKVLQLGVPVVTAFHVTRYIVVLVTMGPLFKLARARAARRAGDPR